MLIYLYFERIEFSCSGEHGAILSLLEPSSRRSVQPTNRAFIDYFKAHYDAWTLFGRKSGIPVEPEDLILVRGWVKTGTFVLGAITQEKYSYDFYPASRSERKTVYTTADHYSFKPNLTQIIQYRSGPDYEHSPRPVYFEDDEDNGQFIPADGQPSSPIEAASPVDEQVIDETSGNLTGLHTTVRKQQLAESMVDPKLIIRDMCIFLNYFKLRKRGFLPEKIIANAESKKPPHSPPEEDDHRGLRSETSRSGDTPSDRSTSYSDRWKPLDELLMYLLRYSDAEIAIACDDDVFKLCEGVGWPDNFYAFYEQLRPRIYVDNDNGKLSPFLL
ncbi:hypothetical protein C8Q75DRAFT_811391 [Abortiporus biennis]|nr:hypothetical protein C8Q75DRAFT_811391 [Abortiporus biennis]